MAFCPSCGSEVGNAKFCQNCGSAIEQNSSPNSKFCSNCGSEIDYKAEICPKCGVRQNQERRNMTEKHCVNCGSLIDVRAEICPKCGVRQMSQTQSDKSTFITLVLSFILPGLGHFYLGLTKKGIILLILGLLLSPSFLYGIGLVYLIVWGYGLYDSYKQSEALSRGENVEDW